MVISKEVRELSRQTSNTAGEISRKMVNVEDRVEGVSRSMEQILEIVNDIQNLNRQIIEVVDTNRKLSDSIQDKSNRTVAAVGEVSSDIRKVVSEAEGLYEIGRTVEKEIEVI